MEFKKANGAPGPTYEAIRGIPVHVQWINNIAGPHFLPVDPTLDWANPNFMSVPLPPFPSFPPGFPLAQQTVPIVPHLHGGENPSYYDGYPDAWWTADRHSVHNEQLHLPQCTTAYNPLVS